MKNLLDMLIELAHTPSLQSADTNLSETSHQIKQLLSSNQQAYFSNQRTVALINC